MTDLNDSESSIQSSEEDSNITDPSQVIIPFRKKLGWGISTTANLLNSMPQGFLYWSSGVSNIEQTRKMIEEFIQLGDLNFNFVLDLTPADKMAIFGVSLAFIIPFAFSTFLAYQKPIDDLCRGKNNQSILLTLFEDKKKHPLLSNCVAALNKTISVIKALIQAGSLAFLSKRFTAFLLEFMIEEQWANLSGSIVSLPVFGIALIASFYALKGFFNKSGSNQEGATFLKYFTMTEFIPKICALIYAITNAALYFNNELNFSAKGLQGDTREKIIAGTILGASTLALIPYTMVYFVKYYEILSNHFGFNNANNIFQRLANHKKLWVPLVVVPATAFKALGQGSKSLTENLPEAIVEAFDLSALPSWLPLVLALISALACFITFFIFGSSVSKKESTSFISSKISENRECFSWCSLFKRSNRDEQKPIVLQFEPSYGSSDNISSVI